jgi:hypothetical protein
VHEALEHIEIRVTDRPGEECEPGEEDLLGLYAGTPLTERSLDDIIEGPDIIHVYRRPRRWKKQRGWSAAGPAPLSASNSRKSGIPDSRFDDRPVQAVRQHRRDALRIDAAECS